LRIVNQIGVRITSGLDFETLMQTIYEQCQQIGDTDTFYLALYDDTHGMLSFPFYYKDGEKRPIAARNIREQSGIAGQVIEQRQTIYIPDQSNMPAGYTPIRQPGIPTWSFIGVPLIMNNRVIGVLSMQSHAVDAYSPEQIQTLELLGIQVAIAIQNSQLFEQVQNERNLANALINNLPGGFALINQHGSLVRWNKYLADSTGYTFDEIGAIDTLSLIVPLEQQRIADLIEKVLAGERIITETQLVSKDNAIIIPFYAVGTRVLVNDEAHVL
jgi:PAS domain S-box-containing protein